MTSDRLFLDYSTRKLRQLEERIEACLNALDDERIWARGGENQNAIGNLVLHLCGNVRQWIVAGVGGQADVRERDAEFAARAGTGVRELTQRLRAAVDDAVAAIASLPPERLGERVAIQKYDVSVLEAIYHVVEHFSMHAGQILFATKMLTGSDLGFHSHLRPGSAHGQTTP